MTGSSQADTGWWVHDRFGLFIHWGIYSLAAFPVHRLQSRANSLALTTNGTSFLKPYTWVVSLLSVDI